MWRVNNYQGEQIWYEVELIEKIKAQCNDKLTQSYDITDVTKRILQLIKSYEGER